MSFATLRSSARTNTPNQIDTCLPGETSYTNASCIEVGRARLSSSRARLLVRAPPCSFAVVLDFLFVVVVVEVVAVGSSYYYYYYCFDYYILCRYDYRLRQTTTRRCSSSSSSRHVCVVAVAAKTPVVRYYCYYL